MITGKQKAILISTFLWIGFVCAISFMEAWLKFRAPGATLPIGLSIGRLVFAALNYVEWVFALIIIGSLFASKSSLLSAQNRTYSIALLILIIQSIWTLPALDARAELHIIGANVPPSFLHFYYVGMEIIKVTCLTLFGLKLINKL